MFDELDQDDFYAELVMLRGNETRAFIVVEGPSDCVVFDRFINSKNFTTVPAHGKVRALGAIERTLESNFPGLVYSILDRDWVGFLEQGVDHHSVVYTDFYDLDACIFFAPEVYEAIAATFSTDQSFKHGEDGCKLSDISNACVKLAFPLGLLRYISRREGLKLNVSDFPLSTVVDENASRVDLEKMILVACRRAGRQPEDYPELLNLLESEIATIANREEYCSGHDLAKAFHVVAKKFWACKAGHDIIERAARVVFSEDGLKQTAVFRECERWMESAGVSPWNGV